MKKDGIASRGEGDHLQPIGEGPDHIEGLPTDGTCRTENGQALSYSTIHMTQ